MRRAGRIVAAVLDVLKKMIEPGIITEELDAVTAEELGRYGVTASFKGYRGFPANLCVSINDEVVHGIPGKRALEEGDLVSLDFGAIYEGFHGDAAITVGVGEVSPEARRLLQTTEGALRAGVDAARNGAHLSDISAAIQEHVEARGFSVVRQYGGHGIGHDLHEDPHILNYGAGGQGPLLRMGMTMALEPMVNIGDWRTRVGSDGWTVSTADGSLSAHFEHTIAITDGEAEVLTCLE